MPMTREEQANANQQRLHAWHARRWYHWTRQDDPPLVLQAAHLPRVRQRIRVDTFDKVMIGLNLALWGSYFALYLRV